MSANPSSIDKQTKAEQSFENRALFIRIARQFFAEQGYAHTSIEQIVAQTDITEDAFYNHFHSMADLLRAVCEQMQAEIQEEILRATEGATDSFEALQLGCDSFLNAVAKTEIQQILLIDAPAALSWTELNRIDREYGFGLLLEGVKQAIADGHFKAQSAEVIATMINGAINESILWAVQGDNVTERLMEVRTVFHQLLIGLKDSSYNSVAKIRV
ncbi:MAG: TetR/AcrR family transcriptional regulator [Nostoc sp. ChiSLP01]|nr:TetR/AcrR family transcriptional regulator [Nostoc sp. CmiSLP01]MDZ8282923.1 TetR/AcrR family transcriptional regulator [Nostoc sp. ChiSLP01]